MFVILFDESQDKDIAGEIKNRYYLSPGGLERNQAGIARRICLGYLTINTESLE
jgi:hypothetical protein